MAPRFPRTDSYPPPAPGFIRHTPHVQFTPHVTGTPAAGLDYRGVSIHGFLFEMQALEAYLPPLDLPKSIQQYSTAERLRFVAYYARLLTDGLETKVQITNQLGESRNPAGGPPWYISPDGGNVLLQFYDPVTNHWLEEQDYPDVGVKIRYYVEIYFE